MVDPIIGRIFEKIHCKNKVLIHDGNGMDWFVFIIFVEVNSGVLGVKLCLNSGWAEGLMKHCSDGLVDSYIKRWLLSWFE